ncbi:MAG: SO_0444 family Cu/Zn efflux transporter [Phycisphaerae bacterium]|nr:SO_0444 family Cu/Zn efflux transporter [Phycisphaerae bacterium]
METLQTFFYELWRLMLELSPWLLLGMFIAGILHVLLPKGLVKRHLGGKGFSDVFKAVAIGVPMPLCSCGVIPAAIGLKKDGASTGAVTGFLISTPQTGVDSILVCATFLGWPFAIFKVVSALISGLIGGMLVNLFDKTPLPTETQPKESCCCHQGKNSSNNSTPCDNPKTHTPAGPKSFREPFHFAFITLLRDIYRWLIVGIIIAAIISTLIPEGALKDITITQGILGMLTMLVISLPMYVCATASVPLAASLIAAGMSPGSALVLLMAGPTTNIATIGAILRTFGKTTLTIYLATVATLSITLGFTFDWLLTGTAIQSHHIHPLPEIVNIIAAGTLSALLLYFIASDLYKYLSQSKAPPTSCCGNHK